MYIFALLLLNTVNPLINAGSPTNRRRVFRGVEASAYGDHVLVVAEIRESHPKRTPGQSTQKNLHRSPCQRSINQSINQSEKD